MRYIKNLTENHNPNFTCLYITHELWLTMTRSLFSGILLYVFDNSKHNSIIMCNLYFFQMFQLQFTPIWSSFCTIVPCWHYWHFKRITQHRFKRYFGQTTRGFCITIMRRLTRSSWPFRQKLNAYHSTTTIFTWFRSMWLLAISQTQKTTPMDTVLIRLKRYKPNRRRLWRQFRKSNLTSVSTIGKTLA